MLYDNKDFEVAHQSVAEIGDTSAPSAAEGDRYVIPSLICLISAKGVLIYHFRLGQHFISFIKEDGRLWELEGSRVSFYPFHIALHHNMLMTTQKGPLDRGALAPDEDVLSLRAIELGIGRVIKMVEESGGTDLRFSVIALAKAQ